MLFLMKKGEPPFGVGILPQDGRKDGSLSEKTLLLRAGAFLTDDVPSWASRDAVRKEGPKNPVQYASARLYARHRARVFIKHVPS